MECCHRAGLVVIAVLGCSEASDGFAVIPWFGHENMSANWSIALFKSDHEDIRAFHGPVHRLICSGATGGGGLRARLQQSDFTQLSSCCFRARVLCNPTMYEGAPHQVLLGGELPPGRSSLRLLRSI